MNDQDLDGINAQRIKLGLKPLASAVPAFNSSNASKKSEQEDEADEEKARINAEKALIAEKNKESAKHAKAKIEVLKSKRKTAQLLSEEPKEKKPKKQESTKDWLSSFADRHQQAQSSQQTIAEKLSKSKQISQEAEKSSAAGLLIEHGFEDLEGEEAVILVLKDEPILKRQGVQLSLEEPKEDVLVSVSLMEKEKTRKKLELKDKLKNRGIMIRGVLQDDGYSDNKKILAKYDEVIDNEDDMFT